MASRQSWSLGWGWGLLTQLNGSLADERDCVHMHIPAVILQLLAKHKLRDGPGFPWHLSICLFPTSKALCPYLWGLSTSPIQPNYWKTCLCSSRTFSPPPSKTGLCLFSFLPVLLVLFSLVPGTLLMSPFPTSNLAVCYCGVSCCSAHHCLCAVNP